MRKFALIVLVLSLVSDGWSGKPSPVLHQLLLLVPSGFFAYELIGLLGPKAHDEREGMVVFPWAYWLVAFEVWSVVLFFLEAHHFKQFGYRLDVHWAILCLLVILAGWCVYLLRRSGWTLLSALISTYSAGMVLAIRSFPLNYLRSDMLPVIGWADLRLIEHLNPYSTMRVGQRIYDFPYLPGMLLAFWPAAILRIDLRWAALVYLGLSALVIFAAAKPFVRTEVAALLGLFLLCPFLQYRHDLYLEPHWFTVVVAVVLMQRRHFIAAAVAWGMSCALYQLSWVIFPFVLLNAYRRGKVREAGKVHLGAAVGFLAVAGPFLQSAAGRISSNTVGQWSRLPHAFADPINLSYWLTFAVRPDQLKWVQAVVLVGLFGWCCWRGRCTTLADTLRWMCCALALFIPLNVIVDGYFYLTLALVLLLFVCAESGWWQEPKEPPQTPGLFGESSVPVLVDP